MIRRWSMNGLLQKAWVNETDASQAHFREHHQIKDISNTPPGAQSSPFHSLGGTRENITAENLKMWFSLRMPAPLKNPASLTFHGNRRVFLLLCKAIRFCYIRMPPLEAALEKTPKQSVPFKNNILLNDSRAPQKCFCLRIYKQGQTWPADLNKMKAATEPSFPIKIFPKSATY